MLRRAAWRVRVASGRTFSATPAGGLNLGDLLQGLATGTQPAQQAHAHHDIVVIGGGSGGLACAKEAAALGASVALVDHVAPSPHGTVWGLGGTCVNVGCVPKKLMHAAALHGENLGDAKEMGWLLPEPATVAHDWQALVTNISSYIRATNWKYKQQLMSAKVSYINARARLKDASTVAVEHPDGQTTELTAKNIVIAVGGRPKYPGVPGDQHCITSDDVFQLQQPPGRTLIIGASYIALETAGFLHGLGCPVTVMVRSTLLRGFDRQMAQMIGDDLSRRGVVLQWETQPVSFSRTDEGTVRVTARSSDGTQRTREYDTVVAATGRQGACAALALDAAGVRWNADTGKVPVDGSDRTNAANVYAVGDVQDGRPELAPVAIQAGRRLARRLLGASAQLMDYDMVATTVFTPLEYACVGLTEEAAVRQLGAGRVEVYHTHMNPLEWAINTRERGGQPERPQNACYAKVIVDQGCGGRVVGVHYLGPNAGEIMQGFALAVKLGVTKDDMAACVGIHPTLAEELVLMDISKSSGQSPLREGC